MVPWRPSLNILQLAPMMALMSYRGVLLCEFSCIECSVSLIQSTVQQIGCGARVEAPVDIVVPCVLAEALEEVEDVGVLQHQLCMFARQCKPLAALAPVLPQLPPHAPAEPPRIRPLPHTTVCHISHAPVYALVGVTLTSKPVSDNTPHVETV